MKPRRVPRRDDQSGSRSVSRDAPHRHHSNGRPSSTDAWAALTDVLSRRKVARRIAPQIGGGRRAADQLCLVVSTRRLTGLVHIPHSDVMALVADLCASFAASGFKRIIFLNGH